MEVLLKTNSYSPMKNLKINSFKEYEDTYNESVKSPIFFWEKIAAQFLWRKKWDQCLSWNFTEPQVKWFDGGLMNITENIFERNFPSCQHETALIWEPNEMNSEVKRYTYFELYHEVNKCANGLREIGVQKGDRVCIYLPMIPELAITVLACARIGAVHSVVFAGFSSNSLADRINDAEASFVVTSDILKRGSKELDLKSIVEEAILSTSSVKKILIVSLLSTKTESQGIFIDWHTLISKQPLVCDPEIMNSEDPLFILYTSGSTGKPKGVVHSCAGYMVYTAYTFLNVYQFSPGDIHWCTADIGWITGHSYILYGPLLCGATTVLFEGVPTYPNAGRFWDIIDKFKVTQFLTAPTAIRSLMGYGIDVLKPYQLSSLKIIGTVGEPINEEAWHWYHTHIGKEKCPIVDNWWQTETGGIMISGLGGISPLKPTFAGYPLPGIQPVLLDENGAEISENNKEGSLCIKYPWPSIIRTTFNNHERCKEAYFSQFPNYYFTGDGAKRDETGMYRIIGRIDDVLNISGHRFGTAEIENAINENKYVIESAVVGYPHPIKGESIYAFVVCEHEIVAENLIRKSIIETVSIKIGKIALPEKIQFVSGLPKTRSGKIMRRILRKIAHNELDVIGDSSTLLDPAIVIEISKNRI